MLTILEISGATKYFIIGFFLISSLSTLGAIASRRFNFKYTYLVVPSILIYLFLGFMLSKWFIIEFTFLVCAILGLFDALVGSRLAIFFRANVNSKEVKILESSKTVIAMTVLAGCLGCVGFSLRRIFF